MCELNENRTKVKFQKCEIPCVESEPDCMTGCFWFTAVALLEGKCNDYTAKYMTVGKVDEVSEECNDEKYYDNADYGDTPQEREKRDIENNRRD